MTPLNNMTPEQRLDRLEQQMREHYHNGTVGNEVQLSHVQGVLKTVTTAAALTQTLAGKPKRFNDQIVIDTSTGTKKLYVFDTIGAVWRSTTIS